MSQPETSSPSVEPVPALSPLAGLLSYLVPGLGQIVQGRVSKGLFFMAILLTMFHAGQAMADWKSVYLPIVVEQNQQAEPLRRSYNPFSSILGYRWHYAGQFFIGVSAWPAIWQFCELPTPSDPFWHDYQREPMYRDKEVQLAKLNAAGLNPAGGQTALSAEGKMNQHLAAGDKTWDVGWIYTVIAGVLNILVIYDAVAGPAFGARRRGREDKPEEKPQAEAAPS
jgi:hypothetical protein